MNTMPLAVVPIAFMAMRKLRKRNVLFISITVPMAVQKSKRIKQKEVLTFYFTSVATRIVLLRYTIAMVKKVNYYSYIVISLVVLQSSPTLMASSQKPAILMLGARCQALLTATATSQKIYCQIAAIQGTSIQQVQVSSIVMDVSTTQRYTVSYNLITIFKTHSTLRILIGMGIV